MVLQVWKIKRNCQGCNEDFVYFRLLSQHGQSQAYCSTKCKALHQRLRNETRELVDFMDVPKSWQKQLEKLAKRYR